ncbi:MAG: hypothetical protein ACO25F_09990 [Erythrobacter sp.]
MTRFANNSLAAFAAVLLTIVSLHGIVTVPPAQAHSTEVPVLA